MNFSKEEYYQDTTDLSDLDESEETLSLCDLPIYNDDTTTQWNDFSKEADRTLSEEDQELFEFSSCEDFSTVSMCPAKNIIFCGKLIPNKQPPVSEEKTPMLNQNDTEQQHPKKRGLFQWRNTTSFNKSKTSPSDQCTNTNNNFNNNKSKLQQVSSSKSLAFPASEKSPSKARWHLLLFGMMKLPTEMELSDIKNRQHRRTSSSTFIESFASGGEEITVRKSSSRGKGFWRTLSSLKCRNQTTNTVVKASFGCIPRV